MAFTQDIRHVRPVVFEMLPNRLGNIRVKNNKFVVTQYENSHGTLAWRVDGRLHGVRIRKNFKTREEAAAEKATLAVKALQTE